MGMKHGRTICSKHDEIKTRALRIESLARGGESVASFTKAETQYLNQLIDSNPLLQFLLKILAAEASEIYYLAEDAKEDGQSMESGLGDKRKRVRELEAQLVQALLESRHE